MAEMTIRINKRVVERSFFTLIILVLAVLLIMKSDGTTVAGPSVDVTELEQQIETLQAQNSDLESQLAETEREKELEQEAQEEREEAVRVVEKEPEPEPEPEKEEEPEQSLSGEVTVTWTVQTDRDDDSKLSRVLVTLDNGLDKSEELEYKFYWDGLTPGNTVNIKDTVFLKSGQKTTVEIFKFGESSYPSSGGDVVILEVDDSDGNLVEKLTRRL